MHIIREEDLSLTTAAIGGLNVAATSDDEDDNIDHDDHPALSAAAVAAAARSSLRPPSLQTLLEDLPHSAALPHTSSGGDSDEKSKCKLFNEECSKILIIFCILFYVVIIWGNCVF